MAATDAYTDKALPWFRKRLINVGSFIIVTEPLGEARARELIPNARLVVDSKNIGHYLRLTPDNRLAFGGRARFAPSNPASDVKSGDILKREMTEIFPQLAEVAVDYVWGGMVGFSWDRLPHARPRGQGPVLLHGLLRPRRPDGHLHGPRGRRDDGRQARRPTPCAASASRRSPSPSTTAPRGSCPSAAPTTRPRTACAEPLPTVATPRGFSAMRSWRAPADTGQPAPQVRRSAGRLLTSR